MYLYWSKESVLLGGENIHCFIFSKTLDLAYVKNQMIKCKIPIDFDEDIQEYKSNDNTINFSEINSDDNFYYTQIDLLENKNYIYIFEFEESGEGQSYHEQIYLIWNYNFNDILGVATEFFETESEITDVNTIKKMRNDLKKKGYHQIEHGRTYLCTMKLYKIQRID
jgi:hypothetical protein